jgi:hypothetical protein
MHCNAYKIYTKYIVFKIFISCASVHACRKSGRHLIAYEADDIIFNKILQPLRELSSQNPVVGQSSQPPRKVAPRKVARKSHLSM